jgi:hypothetical protein
LELLSSKNKDLIKKIDELSDGKEDALIKFKESKK